MLLDDTIVCVAVGQLFVQEPLGCNVDTQPPKKYLSRARHAAGSWPFDSDT